MGWQDPEFQKGWNAVFDDYIETLTKRMEKTGIPIFSGDATELSPKAAGQAARRETIGMARRAVQHLKDGGQNGEPGLISTALSEMSLRNTNAAQALGVIKPKFETEVDPTEFRDGTQAALTQIENLVFAAAEDMDKSVVKLHEARDDGSTRKLRKEEPEDGKPDLDDPEMKKIADNILDTTPLDPAQFEKLSGDFNKNAKKDPVDEAIAKQAAFTLQVTENMYRWLLDEMKNDVEALQNKHQPGVIRARQAPKRKKDGPGAGP